MEERNADGLTAKQERFCHEYMVDMNAHRAAIRAGYKGRNLGSKMMKNARVSAYLQKVQQEINSRVDISAEAVLKELALTGFSNIQDYLDENYCVVNIARLKRDIAAAIVAVEIKETVSREGAVQRSVKIKLHNKLPALELLGRHLGIFE